MQRRNIMSAGAAAAAILPALASPALAQAMPEVRWRCASSFPRALDTIYGAGEHVARRVAALTDNKFRIQVFPAGELVPGLATLDAVQAGTVECTHTASYYFVGKDPTFAFDGTVPFGMNFRQINSWLIAGGGREVMKDFFATYNVLSIPAGNTGAQMGGWFRREIRTVEDLRGLKMRIGGFAGNVLAKLGVVAQQIAGGDIYPALERGTIDAAEWVGPHDDEKLGFNKVAPYYYTPGWWEGSGSITGIVSTPAWAALSPIFKEIFEVAAAEQNSLMMARYDARNPDALRRMIAQGTQLRSFPRVVMEAAYKASFETFEETAAANEDFRTLYAHWKPFLDSSNSWFRVAEFTMDAFRYANPIPGR